MEISEKALCTMGGDAKICIYDAESSLSLMLLKDAEDELDRLRMIFDMFDQDSEISKLNHKRDLLVSNEMIEVLQIARRYYAATAGRFDPGKGRRIMERKNMMEGSDDASSLSRVKITGNQVSITDEATILDLGAVAKGYIGDKVSEYLMEWGAISGLVDLRGDIRFFGSHEEIVKIMHPRKSDEFVMPFKVKGKGVATSGDYRQYYGDHSKSHILGQKGLISATAVADTLAEADAAATTACICGPDESREIFEGSRIMILGIDKSLQYHMINGFEKLLIR